MRIQSTTSRLVLLVVLAALLALLSRQLRPPAPDLPALPPRQTSGSQVFVDVAGWYRRTEHETAVRSPINLTLDALPNGLPMRLGPWQGENRKHDPEIDVWFRSPDLSIERTYRRADGEIVWVSAFGSRGQKSFHLFEHTPDLCYPLDGWQIQSFEVTEIPMAGPRDLPVNHGVAKKGEEGLVFFYIYIWDNPERSAEHGVLSVRIAAPVKHSPEETYRVLAEDFMTQLFERTVEWTRF